MFDADAILSQPNLTAFLDAEDAARTEDFERLMALSQQERVQRGYALNELKVVATHEGAVAFETGSQVTRFDTGDPVLLISAHDTSPGTLVEVGPDRIWIRPDQELKSPGPWSVEPVLVTYSALARQALQKLDEYHGQSLWESLNGVPDSGEPMIGLAAWEEALAELEKETKMQLAPDQRLAFAEAVQTPRTWGLQGPPGTGKTVVAAFVAEALTRRLQHRVLVTAVSHEAVNRVLLELKTLFPKRSLVKIAPKWRDAPSHDIQTYTHNDFNHNYRKLLRNRPILGATLHTSLLLSVVYGQRGDVVIVDEASQAALAYGALLGSLGFSTLLFGDPCQLNAIFPAELIKHPLATSLLERFASIRPLTKLTYTYRLNRPLAHMIGQSFYPDSAGASTLHSTPEAAERRLGIRIRGEDPWAEQVLAPEHAAVWVSVENENTQRFSLQEAALVHRLVTRLVADGIPGQQIAIVTPYRQQLRLLRKKLADLPPAHHPRVGTVDTMQGQSVDVVIMTLATSDSGYLNTVDDFFLLPNRWNVAMSRARTKVVVIGSTAAKQAFAQHFSVAWSHMTVIPV